MHGDNAKSHEDAAENEAKRRGALATDDVKAAAGGEDRHHEGKDGQSDVVGHRYRHFEGEHGDEVHRPYAAAHWDRGSHQPHATRKSPGGPHAPAEIEGGVRREGGDENGQSNEIGIVCSGSDHRDRPSFRTPDQWVTRAPTQRRVYCNPIHGAIGSTGEARLLAAATLRGAVRPGTETRRREHSAGATFSEIREPPALTRRRTRRR